MKRRGQKIDKGQQFEALLSMLFRAHPFHGISPGEHAPAIVKCFIEMPENSPVKLELDKHSGHLFVDRPQLYSSLCPHPYGFIPQTYCGPRVAELCARRTGRKRIEGDGDPLDICVLTERDLPQSDMLLLARPIGGLRMVDHGKADDKIIAVLLNDLTFGSLTDISEMPEPLLKKLWHYFLSYKRGPEEKISRAVQIHGKYGREESFDVIRRSIDDYHEKYGSPKSRLHQLKMLLADELELPEPH